MEEQQLQTSIAIEMEEKEASGDESVALTEESPFRFDAAPLRLYHFAHQFRSSGANNNNYNNFLKGVKWSPDGSCFLTCSDDNSLRLFYLPENACTTEHTSTASSDSYGAGLVVNEGESVYDYCWYPYMSASDPTGCVFASTSRDHPIHLWDCITGQLRCTYRAYDAVDEITAALSVSFNSPATKLFAGYNKVIRVFDVHRPGREYAEYSLSKGEDGASAGLVSSICFAPAQAQSSMFALGSYNQTTTVYEENSMEPLYILHGQQGGVTQVLFSKDGNYLYTGGRKDPYILCWDIRNTGTILYKLYRSSENTNQRISFDIEPSGRYLGTGGQDGLVHIYDLLTGQWVSGVQAAADTVNGLSFHPYLPLAASSSGHRRFGMTDDDDDSEAFSLAGDENCCSVWRFSSTQEVLE
ncbi:putative guanine nucleotide-binding protein [Carex littledalei]|uniref:Putative guanine nucleotide-binding protein n=1 Tax=Carex littledalei TaxID=544730 RepID=A0A833QGU5_9POAL|nr:putative guanine nucleotide-binding protein [Carex littledalei]